MAVERNDDEERRARIDKLIEESKDRRERGDHACEKAAAAIEHAQQVTGPRPKEKKL